MNIKSGCLLTAALVIILLLAGCQENEEKVKGSITGKSYTILDDKPLYNTLYTTRWIFPTEAIDRLRETLIRDPTGEYISNFGAEEYNCVEFHADESASTPGSEKFIKKEDMTETGIQQRADTFLSEMGIYPTGDFYVEAHVGKKGEGCSVNYYTTYEGVSLPYSRIEITFTDDRIEDFFYNWYIVESVGERLNASDYLSGSEIVERFENDYRSYELGTYIESHLPGGVFEPVYVDTTWPSDIADPDGRIKLLHPEWRLTSNSDNRMYVFLDIRTGEQR